MTLNRSTVSPAYGLGSSAKPSPNFIIASSTTYTLTTASQRLLASSTPFERVTATVQPVNCTANQAVFLSMNSDVAAVANTGFAVYASTTAELNEYPLTPVVQGSVQGITANGTCTVLVTEWRLRN